MMDIVVKPDAPPNYHRADSCYTCARSHPLSADVYREGIRRCRRYGFVESVKVCDDFWKWI